MKTTELKSRNIYMLDNNGKEKNVEVTFTGMCGDSYRFFWLENGLEVYFQSDAEFIEKHISEMPKASIYDPYIEHGERKDQKGRNTLTALKPYSGFYYMLDKGYLNCNIHEKICIRSSFCGVCYPSAMVDERIKFEQTL